ncbi:LuxR C-terminal-related transcriptional regulator [Streptomyces sp. NPDC004609]|uniref:helix-turn-helix transcriptional regulator n=1 Tax=Streptomyces sp. NPDC004609 TaxID=3364704 RepID=UPI0036A3D80C
MPGIVEEGDSVTTLGDDIWERWLTRTVARTTPRPALLLLEGRAGTGKSRLLAQLAEHAEAGPRAQVVMTFTPSGVTLARVPAHSGRTEPSATRPPGGREPAGDRHSLRPPPAPGARGPRQYEDTAALARELASLPDAEGPLLLVADDVHRAGPEEAELLRRLLEQPPDHLAAVLAYRPEELARPGLVLGRATAYPARLTVLRIRLGTLDADQVRRMAESRLGPESCPPELIARIHERSAGVPQVVADLLSQLEESYGPKERYTARDLDATGPPVRLAELIIGRLTGLPEQHRAIAGAAAVLDGPGSADDLCAVAGLPEGVGRQALVEALRAGVLQEAGRDLYRFPAPLAGAAVYRELPGPLRQEMHRRAADALARRQPVDWAALAAHRHRAGQTRGWMKAAERAARQCAGAGEHQTAIDLLEQALSHPAVPRGTRARLALLLAHSAVLGLHTDQTVQVLRQILDEHSLPSAVRGRIRLDLGLVLYNQAGRGLQGWVELEQAAAELAEQRPALAARAMSALAMPVMSAVPLERNLYWLDRARKMAAVSDDDEVRTTVAANCVAVQLETGDPSAWDALDRLRDDAADPARLPHVARGLVNAADAALWLGRLPRVGELVEEGLELAARGGAAYVEQDGRGTRLVLDWVTGRWDGLSARARAFVAEAGVMPGPAADARIVLGMLALAQGEWQQMAAWLSGDGHPLPAGSPLPHVAAAAGALVRTALARGDLETAASEAAVTWDRLRDKGVWAWAAELAPWAVEATARAGRRERAEEMTAEFGAGLTGLEDAAPSAVAALAWCRGILAETGGRPAEAVPRYREASAGYAALPRPYAALLTTEAAETCVLAAGAGRRTDGDRTGSGSGGTETGRAGTGGASPDDSTGALGAGSAGTDMAAPDPAAPDSDAVAAAVESLASCVESLIALGASWDTARVRATLRSHRPMPGRRPRGRPAYGDQLSPREQEVVDLASAGLTNREIAATLHLSPRTVEQHVSRARRKLESQSRQPLSRPRPHRAT